MGKKNLEMLLGNHPNPLFSKRDNKKRFQFISSMLVLSILKFINLSCSFDDIKFYNANHKN